MDVHGMCSGGHRQDIAKAVSYTHLERNMSMNKNFNIQLFAENLNTTATMSKEMKTFYEKRQMCIRDRPGANAQAVPDHRKQKSSRPSSGRELFCLR